MPRPLPTRLLVVLEPVDLRPALLQALHDGGARWFWLRAKALAPSEQQAAVEAFRKALPQSDVVLSLGTRAGDGLLPPGADGLHLPRDADPAAARAAFGPGLLLGISTHDTDELARAAAGGADYATLSPLFATASKPGVEPLGPAVFARLAAATPLPLLALGGIGTIEAETACAAGAAGVAVRGGLLRSAEPSAAVAGLLAALSAAPPSAVSGR